MSCSKKKKDQGEPPSKKSKVEEPEEGRKKCESCLEYFSDDDVSPNDENECLRCNPVCSSCNGTLKLDYESDPPICYYCERYANKRGWKRDENSSDSENGIESSSEEEESDPEWKP